MINALVLGISLTSGHSIINHILQDIMDAKGKNITGWDGATVLSRVEIRKHRGNQGKGSQFMLYKGVCHIFEA